MMMLAKINLSSGLQGEKNGFGLKGDEAHRKTHTYSDVNTLRPPNLQPPTQSINTEHHIDSSPVANTTGSFAG